MFCKDSIEENNVMIGLLIGEVAEKSIDQILLLCNGIGYEVSVSQNTMKEIFIGKEITLYTKMIVREDFISLVGFFTKEERELFELLTSVSKIGPKVGLAILSTYEPDTVKTCIVTGNVLKLSKVSGVGKKTAERMILELKDKISIFEVNQSELEEGEQLLLGEDEVLEALLSLGFSKGECQKTVERARRENPNVPADKLISIALSKLSKI